MADQVQCRGCSARFRVHARSVPAGCTEIACPRCSAPIPLRARPTTENLPAKRSPDTRPGLSWRPIDYASVFGRPTPSPPGKPDRPTTPKRRQQPRTTGADHGPSENEPTDHHSPDTQRGAPTRSPESDRPDDVRPLARSLLRKLDKKRGTSTASAPSTARGDVEASGASSDTWVDDDTIDDAVDSATKKLHTTEPDLENEIEPDTEIESDTEIDLDTETEPDTEIDLDTKTKNDTESEPEIEPETEPPTTALAEPDDDVMGLADELDPEATYRLRIGDKVYGDLDAHDLVSLFHRGVWVVADELAEENGAWMPVESHPVFDRLRHVISDGVIGLLTTHGTLVDHRPVPDDEPAPEQQQERQQPPPTPTPEEPTTADSEPAPAEPADEPADPSPAPSAAPPPSRSTLPWLIALVATAVAAGAIVYATVAGPFVGDEPAVEQPVVDEPAIVPEEPPPPDATDVEKAVHYAAAGVTTAAAPSTRELAQQALDDGAYPEARQLAARYVVETGDTEPVQPIFDNAVVLDPQLDHELRNVIPDVEIDAIAPITEGASITLRFQQDGHDRYAFKADRDEWQDGWRVEVAAYKLCELLVCDLDFPSHEAARVSRENFDELYGRVDSPTQQRYADQRFDELIWHERQDPDGTEREYLYGVLKEWVPHYTRWPIEHVGPWRSWLDATQPADEVFDEDVEDFLGRLSRVYDGRFIGGLRRETRGHSPRDLARQVSILHTFDYLTLNYDRHSQVEDYFGTNAHFADGRFVPIDNSAAFQRVELRVPTMDRRIRNVSRFSDTMIATVRLLDPEVVNPVLFPEPTDRERRRLELFWTQRDKLLDYVDELVDEHGEEAVLAFD